jgi:hypothetical protein
MVIGGCAVNTSKASNLSTLETKNVSSSKSLTKNWYAYAPKDNSYTIQFPHQPQEQVQLVDSPTGKIEIKRVQYLDKNNGIVFASLHSNIATDPKTYDVQQGLNTVVEKTVKSTNGRLTSLKKIKLNGFDGREFTIASEKGIFGKGRVFIDPKIPSAYQAFVISKNSQQLDSPSVLEFLNSFSISLKTRLI